MTAKSKQRRTTTLIIIATLVVVFAVLGLVLATAMRDGPGQAAGPDVLAAAAPPLVAPVELMALAPAVARSANAQQPFAAAGFPAAAPFRFTGDSLAAERATDCLAAAVLYEAGDDGTGQRAVAQVVINRARHPAFPGSICAVVFQGSERRTGCQFSFTCDGALNRRYGDAAWQRARGVAMDALHGATFPAVGLATHYHTDWVRPYWSPHLDKLAQIGTHLFFRWPGYWGTPAAFRQSLNGQEPVVTKLAELSMAHAGGAAPDQLASELTPTSLNPVAASAAVSAIIPRANRQLGDTIILTLDRQQVPDSFPALAEAACGTRQYCKVMGWTNPGLAPGTEAMSDMARASMSFSYLRDEANALERALWNCDEFTRETRSQCMRRN